MLDRVGEGEAFAGERELNLFARLEDPPLDRRERDLERVGDLVVGHADHVAEEQRHLEIGVQILDGPPDRVDRLHPLHRLVERLDRRDVVEADEVAGAPLAGAELVEHAVLRHLEEPGRELAAERELRQSVEDPDEDLLRQILGERAITREAKDVVVNRSLVRSNNQRESLAITLLRFTKYSGIWLWERQLSSTVPP